MKSSGSLRIITSISHWILDRDIKPPAKVFLRHGFTQILTDFKKFVQIRETCTEHAEVSVAERITR